MNLTKKRCIPCEGNAASLSAKEENQYHMQTPGWKLLRKGTHKLHRQFTFKDFKAAMAFINKVASIAEKEGHHPDMHVFFNKVVLEIYTHAVNGLTENDFILAKKIGRVK